MVDDDRPDRIEIVDTNVWANMDNLPPKNALEAQCLLACLDWGKAFSEGDERHKLAVDIGWKILNEYRGQIKQGGLAERYLNEILSQPITRLILRQIEYDENGHAILEDETLMTDPSDRKFVAVALTFNPPVPIVNSTDTDWAKDKAQLDEAGIPVLELCPDYIASKMSR